MFGGLTLVIEMKELKNVCENNNAWKEIHTFPISNISAEVFIGLYRHVKWTTLVLER